MINTIKNKGKILAIILRTTYNEKGINFFTPNEFSQQLAYMNHPSGYEIQPHLHNAIQREVNFTKEVLFIKSGKVRVDFYDDEKKYLESNILESGDVILLAFGGHGFVMMEDSEIIEVKQGPYTGESDKTRFKSISTGQIKIKEE
tara:strand:+ start:632 stop:1066 length:435 start_codon:yes stop_codon:yes gene_type:complete